MLAVDHKVCSGLTRPPRGFYVESVRKVVLKQIRRTYPLYVAGWGKNNRSSPQSSFGGEEPQPGLLDELCVPGCAKGGCRGKALGGSAHKEVVPSDTWTQLSIK